MIDKKIKCILYSLFFAFTFLLNSGAGIGVKDMFSNMSEQELINQVQQGEDLMRYMETQATPEERQEFEKAMMEMFNQLSPEDLAEIEAIAETVEPHIQMHNDKKEEPKKEPVAKKKKSGTKVKANDSIRSLLLTINNIIDTVMLKIASDPSLSDFFASHATRSSIALFQRLVSLLSSKQNIKRLSDKKDKENEELIKKIKEFKNNLENKNKEFQVEDSFGLKASDDKSGKGKSRKSYNANIRKLESIIEEFNKGLFDLMPEMERFIRKYEKEDQEMAKLYDDLKKASQKHAKSSQRKRGSTPAKNAPRSKRRKQRNSNQGSGGGNYYDPYNDYGYPYGSKGNKKKKSTAKNKDRKAPEGGGHQRPIKDDKKNPEGSPYDQIISFIDEYVGAYDEKDIKEGIEVYKGMSQKNPYQIDKTTKSIPDHNAKLSRFVHEETKRMNQAGAQFAPTEKNLEHLKAALQQSQKLVRSLSAQEVDSLQKHEPYQQILAVADQYSNALEAFIKSEEAMSEASLQGMRTDLKEMRDLVEAKTQSKTITQQEAEDWENSRKGVLTLQGNYQTRKNELSKIYAEVTAAKNILERSVKSAKRKFERSAKTKRPTTKGAQAGPVGPRPKG